MKHPKRKPKAAAKPGAPKKKLTARERLALARKRAKQQAAARKKQKAAPSPRGTRAAKGKPAHPKPRTVAA